MKLRTVVMGYVKVHARFKLRSRVERDLIEVLLLERGADPETLRIEAESRDLVHKALRKLTRRSPREAAAVKQRFFDGATFTQIGNNLSCGRDPTGQQKKTVLQERGRRLYKKGMRDLQRIMSIPPEFW